MTSDEDHVIDLVFGSGRSQTVYDDGELDVFEAVRGCPTHATEFADRPDVDREQEYRLLRALGSLGSLEETDDERFSLTSPGTVLRAESPGSLRAMVRREEGPPQYANHLANTGREDAVTNYPENGQMGAMEGVVG